MVSIPCHSGGSNSQQTGIPQGQVGWGIIQHGGFITRSIFSQILRTGYILLIQTMLFVRSEIHKEGVIQWVSFIKQLHCQFCPKYSQKIAHSSPSRATYEVSFVSSNNDLCSTFAFAMLYSISYENSFEWYPTACKHGQHGGHYQNYHTGALSSHLSYFNSLDDGVPVEWPPGPQDWCPIILFKSQQLISRWGASAWICWYSIFTEYQEPEQDDRVPAL